MNMGQSNYHTHSHYCDGQGELTDYIQYALSHDFVALGFSGHAPVPFDNKFAISDSDFDNYCNEVRTLAANYKNSLDIKLGLEIDYIPHILDDFTPFFTRGGLDYCIGSVHLVNNPDDDPNNLWFIDGRQREVYDEGLKCVFGGDIKKGVRAFFLQNIAMIEQTHPTIVGHFTKIVMHNAGRYFSEQDPWFRSLVSDTLDAIAASGAICEINTRGIYRRRYNDYYPSRDIIKYMNKLKIPVLVSSDAHNPEDLDNFCGAHQFLHDINYSQIITTL